MEVVAILLVLVVAAIFYEYRVRRPDQIVVAETRDGIKVRKARLYPRHFSTVISKASHSFVQSIEASAKGNLDARVKLAVTVAPSFSHLQALLNVGGWRNDAVSRAAKELETLLLGYVKAYTEQHEIEELSSDRIREHLRKHQAECQATLGIEIVALTVVSFEPVNPQIADAIRQQEQARILEQTEVVQQQGRIAAARTRLKADEEIAALENDLEIRKYALRKEQFEKDAALATQRAEHELQLKRSQLNFDKEEMRLLKESPELLLLTPQAARLAEASQSMKNARTVVTLAPGEAGQGTELLGMFQTLVQGAIETYQKRKKA
jgi:regulator of protease activity HflC (stomatin/prohibitin superfamily)